MIHHGKATGYPKKSILHMISVTQTDPLFPQMQRCKEEPCLNYGIIKKSSLFGVVLFIRGHISQFIFLCSDWNVLVSYAEKFHPCAMQHSSPHKEVSENSMGTRAKVTSRPTTFLILQLVSFSLGLGQEHNSTLPDIIESSQYALDSLASVDVNIKYHYKTNLENAQKGHIIHAHFWMGFATFSPYLMLTDKQTHESNCPSSKACF